MAATTTKKLWYTISIGEDANINTIGFPFKDVYDAIKKTRRMIKERWKLSPFLYFTVNNEELDQLRRM